MSDDADYLRNVARSFGANTRKSIEAVADKLEGYESSASTSEWTQDEIDAQMLDDDEDECGFDFDCHLDPTTGLCGAAGSEACEFECPYRVDRDRIRARVVARRR